MLLDHRNKTTDLILEELFNKTEDLEGFRWTKMTAIIIIKDNFKYQQIIPQAHTERSLTSGNLHIHRSRQDSKIISSINNEYANLPEHSSRFIEYISTVSLYYKSIPLKIALGRTEWIFIR